MKYLTRTIIAGLILIATLSVASESMSQDRFAIEISTDFDRQLGPPGATGWDPVFLFQLVGNTYTFSVTGIARTKGYNSPVYGACHSGEDALDMLTLHCSITQIPAGFSMTFYESKGWRGSITHWSAIGKRVDGKAWISDFNK